MDRTSISRRIGSIKGDIEKLSNTLCAIEKTDIENYPDNYAMLTTDAALRSELIACRMRHLLASSLARLIRNSPDHWSYIGSGEYRYIGVGITYESGMWYCDVALTKDNYG